MVEWTAGKNKLRRMTKREGEKTGMEKLYTMHDGGKKIIMYKKGMWVEKKKPQQQQQSHARTDITNAAALNKMLTAENHLFFHFVLFRSNSDCGSYYWIWSRI